MSLVGVLTLVLGPVLILVLVLVLDLPRAPAAATTAAGVLLGVSMPTWLPTWDSSPMLSALMPIGVRQLTSVGVTKCQTGFMDGGPGRWNVLDLRMNYEPCTGLCARQVDIEGRSMNKTCAGAAVAVIGIGCKGTEWSSLTCSQVRPSKLCACVSPRARAILGRSREQHERFIGYLTSLTDPGTRDVSHWEPRDMAHWVVTGVMVASGVATLLILWRYSRRKKMATDGELTGKRLRISGLSSRGDAKLELERQRQKKVQKKRQSPRLREGSGDKGAEGVPAAEALAYARKVATRAAAVREVAASQAVARVEGAAKAAADQEAAEVEASLRDVASLQEAAAKEAAVGEAAAMEVARKAAREAAARDAAARETAASEAAAEEAQSSLQSPAASLASTVLPLCQASLGTGRPVPESTLGGETTCIVCFSNPKTHLAVPCGHLSACEECSVLMKKCPYCCAPAIVWVHARVV